MPNLLCANLKPSNGGFGEWDWVECYAVEGCEDYFDYEQLLANMTPTLHFERSDALAGLIHNERGRVYRIDAGDKTPDGEPIYSYEMVWVDEGAE